MKALPAEVEIQIEVRLVWEGEIIQHGILSIGEPNATKDFKLAGLAAQRGVYEMLQTLWTKHEFVYSKE